MFAYLPISCHVLVIDSLLMCKNKCETVSLLNSHQICTLNEAGYPKFIWSGVLVFRNFNGRPVWMQERNCLLLCSSDASTSGMEFQNPVRCWITVLQTSLESLMIAVLLSITYFLMFTGWNKRSEFTRYRIFIALEVLDSLVMFVYLPLSCPILLYLPNM